MSALAATVSRWRAWWLPAAAAPADPHAARQGLRLLLLLRVATPITQALTLWLVTRELEVRVPTLQVLLLIGIEFAVAVATWLRLRYGPAVGQSELTAQALLDVSLLAAMLYLTGGTENPFAPMFLLPMIIVSAALRPALVWVVAVATMAAYAVLREYQVPMDHPMGHTHVYELHEDGMVVNYMFTAAFLAFLSTRMHAALRRRERMLSEAHARQMRDESAVAIGTLASGYAHELSSPLATMAVVVGELKRQCAGVPGAARDLEIVETQIENCKRLVSQLAEAGGRRRAEAASAMAVDRVVGAVVDSARALYPGATIGLSVDDAAAAPTIVAEETLRQAIMNLIQNALQSAPAHVDVRAGWSGGELRIDVDDDGPGFRPEVLAQTGGRLDPARRVRGVGMGLMLAATTIERRGGHVAIRNRVEGGACATLHIPLRDILIQSDDKRKLRHGSD